VGYGVIGMDAASSALAPDKPTQVQRLIRSRVLF
jgi:hypothetical protein